MPPGPGASPKGCKAKPDGATPGALPTSCALASQLPRLWKIAPAARSGRKTMPFAKVHPPPTSNNGETVIFGPVTNRRYAFAGGGAALGVDSRDAIVLLRNKVFKRV